ncbi:MAG TPA: hypothetical protein VEC12_03215 [Bacteroidia bacterium]|nr:hypothetical protein [Bacteroidia bacterium]
MLRKLFISLLGLLLWQNCFAYRDVIVLTHLNKDEQHDTFGFNLVTSIPALVYSLLEKDMVTLWDSPRKDVKITFQSLKNIEASTKTFFRKTDDIFFNEVWSSNRRKTQFNILGFSFINKNDKGEQVSYGFVDIEDIDEILGDSILYTNANGGDSISYFTAIYSRNYHFNLVQFGQNTFKDNLLKSIQVKEKAFSKKKKIINKIELPGRKRVYYEIVKSWRGETYYRGIENFLNENPEFFFNNGGGHIFSYLGRDFIFSISKIEVEEIWEKTGNGIVHSPQNIILYFNTAKTHPIRIDAFAKYGLKLDFQEIKTSLASKNFEYLIKKINHQEIMPAQSGKYIRALDSYFWTQITEYVKYD